MAKILCVTVNTAIDKTYRLESLPMGSIRKPYDVVARAGGKGVNVARVLAALGVEATHFGTAGGANGLFIRRSLAEQGIRGPLVRIAAESRLCLILLDDATGAETVVNEPGGPIDAAEVDAIRAGFAKALRGKDVVVLSGSLPRGTPPEFYAECAEEARRGGATVFLDAAGRALEAGIRAAPHMICPNEAELAEALGLPDTETPTLVEALRSVHARGVALPCVKRGARGALLLAGGTVYSALPPAIKPLSAIGSGDAFLAGFLAGWVREKPLGDTLRLATACAVSNALLPGAGFIDRARLDAFARATRVETI